MANGMRSTLPVGWDPGFIFAKAGVNNHFGYEVDGDGAITIGYRVEDGDAVLGAIDAYPVAYAEERLKPAMLEQIGAIRTAKIQSFDLGNMALTLDPTTETRVGLACYWLDKRPQRDHVNWDLGGRNFIKIPRDQMLGLGLAVGDHIQACFDYSEQLAIEVRAAANIDALAAIDLQAGWPGE